MVITTGAVPGGKKKKPALSETKCEEAGERTKALPVTIGFSFVTFIF